MFIIDILIYVVFAMIMSWFARMSERETLNNPNRWDRYLTYYTLFFTVIAALRWNVGSDSKAYTWMFHTGKGVSQDSPEVIWYHIVDFVYGNGLHWAFGLAILGFLQMFFIVKALKQYRFMLIFLPFVMFGGRYWSELMGASRQMVAACIFVWSVRFIIERKPLKYFITIFLASFIHASSIVLLVFYFIPLKINAYKHRWLLLTGFLLCVVLGQTPSLQNYVQLMAESISSIGYERYTEEMTSAVMGETDGALSFGPMMLSYFLIPIFIIWFGPKLADAYGKEIKEFQVWYNVAYFYACVYFFICNISYLFIRPLMYFGLFQMLMATLLFKYLIDRIYRSRAMYLAAISYCVVIFTNSAWDVYKASQSRLDHVTYKVFFMHKTWGK